MTGNDKSYHSGPLQSHGTWHEDMTSSTSCGCWGFLLLINKSSMHNLSRWSFCYPLLITDSICLILSAMIQQCKYPNHFKTQLHISLWLPNPPMTCVGIQSWKHTMANNHTLHWGHIWQKVETTDFSCFNKLIKPFQKCCLWLLWQLMTFIQSRTDVNLYGQT